MGWQRNNASVLPMKLDEIPKEGGRVGGNGGEREKEREEVGSELHSGGA